MKWIIISFWLFFTSSLFAQSKTDSLLHILPTLKEDSTKVQVYLELQNEYHRKDLNIALDYVTKAEELAERLGLILKQAEAKWHKSYLLTELRMYENARKECEAALVIFNQLGDSAWIADVKLQLADIATYEAKNEEAIRMYLEGLSIAKSIGDKNREALVHNSLGGIYKTQKQYGKALENYERALSLVREIDLTRGISACLTNIAGVYVKMEQYAKAIQYHKEALEIKVETGDRLGEARVLNSLGIVYNNLKKYNEAEKHLVRAGNLAKEVGDSWLLSATEYGLARSAFGKGNFQESINIANRVLGNISDFNDPNFEVQVYQSLSEAYNKVGQFQKAYLNEVMVNKLSDSLYNEQIVRVTNDLEVKYQNDQKVKEIALLESEKELQDLQLNKRINERNSIVAFSIIMLILAALLYNQFRIKKKANKKLQELDRMKSNFFANISHEFRTPLTLIKGPIERLEQNPEENLTLENIKMIRRNSTRVLKLVNQLLDLSKIDEGNLKLVPTEGDVYKCLRAATSSFNSHAAQRQFDYRVQIPQSVLWASFDRDKLEKVVYNLLSNAFKFSDDGSMVSFEANYSGQDLKIQVSDSGKGIPSDQLPFIFDRFYQADSGPTRDREGSGIGLSLSKDLVELMDGTITVSSEIGNGTFFTIQLPIQQIKTGQEVNLKLEEEIDNVVPKSVPFSLVNEDIRKLPNILLVEDNADMRHFVKESLIQEYRVAEATDGSAGLNKAIADPPDLIITDLMMPKMDGLELCKKLKKDVNTSHIPVIMLTAKAGMENKLEGLETGADDYLTKPFDANELLVRTKNLVEQRKKLRELFSNKKVQIDPKKITVTSIDQQFLEKVLNLLEKQYLDGNFGVPQMQQALAMSKSQLHRKLKALTNEGPGELLRNFRLKRAAQLLDQKADSVTQIAYKVGFNDLSYFTKCFKELFGVVPSAYSKTKLQD